MIATAIRRLRVIPVREALAAVTPGPRLRRMLVAIALVTATLAAGYMLWLRNSSLVKVESVIVTGVTGQDGERVRSALVGAGRQSTTLRVDEAAIEDAAQPFPTIRAIEVRTDFPHGMTST